MTKPQIKFLKLLNNNSMTAIELCQKLNIQPYEHDDISDYYNALNDSIGYLTSDEEQEIDKCFTISFDNTNTALGDEVYKITDAGKKFLKHYSNELFNRTISIAGLIISFLALVFAIMSFLFR